MSKIRKSCKEDAYGDAINIKKEFEKDITPDLFFKMKSKLEKILGSF